MKYYIVGTKQKNDLSEEWATYSGFDFEEAKKTYEEEKYNYDCCLTWREKERYEVFIEYFDLPDDVDENNGSEVINAICNCIGSFPMMIK